MLASCCKLTRTHCLALGVIAFLLLGLTTEYFYLNSLYLVDETYDVSGPRELLDFEKLTIRFVAALLDQLMFIILFVNLDSVVAPQDKKELKKFVETYGICPYVHTIQIVWPHTHTPVPSVKSTFVFSKTHSNIVFERPLDTIRHASPEDHTLYQMYNQTVIPTEGT